MKKALIVWGGWDGHVPDQMACLFEEILTAEQFEVEVSDTLEAFSDVEKLKTFDLIVPCITMSTIEEDYVNNVSDAVIAGTGLAGCHGGMCDTFRDNVVWAFMTGGTWVAHPGDATVEYPVRMKNSSSELIQGLEDFTVTSEQYYLHVDPAVEILATTPFPVADGPHTPNGHFEMPVAWTKKWGTGRVYYNALGHTPDTINTGTAREMVRRGLLWAAR